MAVQTLFINAYANLTGTLTLKLFAPGTDTILYSATATAGTNNPSSYSAPFTDLPVLRYNHVLFSGATPVASGYVQTAAATGNYLTESIGDVGAAPTGAREVNVTVTDGTNPLENATVRLTEGAFTTSIITDGSGVATGGFDDATYAVSITKAGYSFAGTSLVVDGDKTPTYAMSSVTVSLPTNPAQSTGTIRCYNEQGVVESGVNVSVQVQKGPGTAGLSYDSALWSVASNVNGDASFVGLVQGAVYRAYRGSETNETEYFEFQVPVGRSSFLITELIGSE